MKTYFKTLWENPAAARKALVALIGVLVQVALVAFPAAAWLPVLVALATALGVYSVHNAGPVRRNKNGLHNTN